MSEQGSGIRFVVVATTLRGGLDVPEPLDDANQWRAFSAWREDASRQVRTEFELRYDDARAVWAKAGNEGTENRFQVSGVGVQRLARGAA